MNILSSGSTIRAVALNVGDTTLNDAGLDGYFDNVVVETADEIVTYDFEMAPLTPPEVTIESPTPLENSFVRGLITGRATAIDEKGIAGSYLRVWKGAFESGIANLVVNCQNAPGGTLLGTTEDASCQFDSTTATDGVYVFSAQFIDSDNKWGSALRSFNVDNTAPSFPEHVSPANNSERKTVDQDKIDWTDSTDTSSPVTYIYQSSHSSDTNPDGSFTSPVYTSSPLTDSEIPTPGTPEGVYYWHVKAVDSAGNSSPWSVAWKIIIDNTAPAIPTHESPANNSSQNFNTFDFEWTDVVDAVEYEWQGSQNPSTDVN
jgi:hypothetical protein